MKMKTNTHTPVLHCAAPNCRTTITPDERHVANLTARGAWTCSLHLAA